MRRALIILLAILFANAGVVVFPAKAASVNVSAIIDINCGNGVRNLSEACEGEDLGGASCVSLGFASGVLSCTASCNFDTSACVAPVNTPPPTPPPSGAGGGGGGGNGAPIPTTGVVFSGLAYPNSTVTLLKDAAIVASTMAGSDSRFQISLAGLSSGTYNFSLYSEDDAGNRSSLSTFPVDITQGVTISLGGIFIAPTISVDKEQVRQGDVITIFGKTSPKSDVAITVHSANPLNLKAIAGDDGGYSYSLDSDLLELGSHLAKSRSSTNGEVSPFGKAVSFTVGSENIISKPTEKIGPADLSGDNKVNIVDFSIMAYWFKRPSPPQNIDLNHDGKIDLTDFSILAFHWTG